MPPAQKPTGAEGAARALHREQPVTADAATPTPVNNKSAGAEGAEFISQDLPQDPPGNDDLLAGAEGAERALSREQPVTADAAAPTPVNNESAGAEGAEFIAQDLPQDPPGNDDLLAHEAELAEMRAATDGKEWSSEESVDMGGIGGDDY